MGERILIIDDDRELCDLLVDFLALEGFELHAMHDGADAVEHLRASPYDAVVLDIMLPGMQGLDVLRTLRAFSQTPVLMLTARGEDTDRILGLELGADDYLPKPCNPRELAARLRAVLRRANTSAADPSPPKGGESLRVGDTQLNPADRTAQHRDCPLNLTSTEFNVLLVLMASAGSAVDKESLSREALGRSLSAYDRSIDVHISKIRKKFAEAGATNPIVSIRGQGYQFTVSEPEPGA